MTNDASFQIIRIAIQAESFVIDLKFTAPPELAECIKSVSIPIADLEDQVLGQTVQNFGNRLPIGSSTNTSKVLLSDF